MSAYVIEATSHAELFRDLAERRDIGGTVFELHAIREVCGAAVRVCMLRDC